MIKLNTGQNHKGNSQLLPFFDIMEFTEDRIENDKNILPSLLKMFSMIKIKCWCNKREDEIKHTGVKVAIRCGNCGK